MKNLLRVLAFAVCGFLGMTFADDYKSLTIGGGTSSDTIRVHSDQFMFIRNFTQEDGTTRGVVMVSKPPSAAAVNVLTAALLDETQPPEVINPVVIAGPADVVFTCEASATKNCFASYKKESN